MATVFCPECGARIVLGAEEVELGQCIDCPECGTPLEVISIHPLDLDYAIESWEWEDEEEE